MIQKSYVRKIYRRGSIEFWRSSSLYTYSPPETLNLSEKPGILLLMDGNQEIISGSNYDSTPDVLDKMYKK